jgi:signal transduction histidine kinase
MYVYYLVLLSIIRFLGVIIFFDFYRKERRIRFIAQTGAFLFLAMSPLIEFFILDLSDIELYNFIFLISEIFSILGIFILALIFFDYVSDYDKKIELAIGTLISTGLILLYFVVPFDFLYLIIQFILLVIIASVFVHAIYNRTRFLTLTSNSIYFFIVIAILIVFNLLLSIDPFILELEILLSLSTISLSAFGIFIFVHLEYTLLLTQKNLLKDNYSHKLAQILQAIMGRVELAKRDVDSMDVESHLNEAMDDCTKGSNLLYKIREL